MPTITQVSNANSTWNGTVPFDADPAVTDFKLYAAETDTRSAYRYVATVSNAGPGPVDLGTYTYGRLFLSITPRVFHLRATSVKGGQESDISAEPTLTVAPATSVGWTLGQLLNQGVNPQLIVGQDPTTGNFFPLKVIEASAGEWVLDTNTTATISAGDLQLGALELKDHTNDDRARVKQISGLAAGEFAVATYDAFDVTDVLDDPASGSDLNATSGVGARHRGSALFLRKAGATAIALEIGIRRGGTDFPIVNQAAFAGNSESVLDLDLPSGADLYVKTTGAGGGDDFAALFVNKIYP